jgi:large subunit ribosomal protein L21
MYAIVEIAGKQYKVRKNDKLFVPRQQADVDATLTFDRVLLVSNGEEIHVGAPIVEGAKVEAKVLDHVKADKVLVFKKKRRKRFKVKRGHRQPYTRIEINDVTV